MRITQKVKKILDWYEGDPPGVKANLARILCTGKLAGTGKVVILPVDQGFEHGPARSFAPNPPAYDPHYHYQLAIEDASDAAACASVIFVDASLSGAAPFSDEPVAPGAGVACFASHAVPPGVVVGLCRSVYGRSPDARVIGIRGYAFDFEEGLTERARANLEQAVAYIRSLLPSGDAHA